MRDQGLGSREPSFEVGSWLGQVEPNVPVVGGQSWHGSKKAANAMHVEANRVHCPLSTSAIHCPLETRRRLETCRNFAPGTGSLHSFALYLYCRRDTVADLESVAAGNG